MNSPSAHRKTMRHYDLPGHVHELTFSCYRRLPLLTNNKWRSMLAHAIDQANRRHGFQLAAFVFMPEHVHLLVWPVSPESRVHRLLKAIKQPFSNRIRRMLEAEGNGSLLSRLTVQERPGKTAFRFWQEGGGYDRNLIGAEAVEAAIDYLHLNPVRRGLVKAADQWRWSSAPHQILSSDGDSDVPHVEPLPSWFWDADRNSSLD